MPSADPIKPKAKVEKKRRGLISLMYKYLAPQRKLMLSQQCWSSKGARSLAKKIIVGAVETGDLPELGIYHLSMRVDTGATTSALHVENIEEFREHGKRWVSFDLLPEVHNVNGTVRITCRVKGRKTVKRTNADSQKRVVIDTRLNIGKKSWPIKLTLTDRSEMNYPMLLGREAMVGRVTVDPEFQYLQDVPEKKAK